MALPEEHNEQDQSLWHSRFARERQDFSASVEATMHDEQDQEEDEAREEHATAQGKSLIPPRLSLQSRPMPVIRLDDPDDRSTRKLKVPETVELPATPSQQTRGFLARFARRLTSSLAILGTGTHPFPTLPPPSSDESQLLSRQRDEVSLLPPDIPLETNDQAANSPSAEIPASEQQPENTPLATPPEPAEPQKPAERSNQQAPSPLVVGSPPVAPMRLGRHRQRLAGRTTKVHLQTAPVPAVPRPVTPRVSALDVAANAKEKEDGQRTTLSAIPTVTIPQQVETIGTHEASPAQDVPAAPSSANEAIRPLELPAQAAPFLTGSGVFNVGQREVTIPNDHVSSSSLVLVTLTANPGPIVVQYVSLLPQSGFTVHLTAPAEARATFNYAILTGEQS
ncbi:MAG: hypothetical protein J2P37_01525 [Ktedonobacteraceae bacterium]|nr:hypothetical protein [Ktedonobacteraceae bacterium]